jgi:hypothetical protein
MSITTYILIGLLLAVASGWAAFHDEHPKSQDPYLALGAVVAGALWPLWLAIVVLVGLSQLFSVFFRWAFSPRDS